MFHLKEIKIKNFKSIWSQIIHFWINKTVFVGKNGTWKTNILHAVEKIFNPYNHNIKIWDFWDPKKKIKISVKMSIQNEEKIIDLQAYIKKWKVIQVYSQNSSLLKNIDLIYISSDRKINTHDPENGYYKLINLILENKKQNIKKWLKSDFQNIQSIHQSSSNQKTTLFITLLKLYLYSLNDKNTEKRFKLFVIDQPENFLHPHGTKLIDRLLQQIWEKKNTQILYSTHSTELVSNFKKGSYELSDIVFVRQEKWFTHTKKIQNEYGKYNKIMINLIFKNASVFFSDAVLLVEWETEKISIPNIYENWNWKHEEQAKSSRIKQKYNLDLRNINVIDVWGKWALCEWYAFACEVFGKKNVFAMIDKDPTFDQDRMLISKVIKKVHGRVVTDDTKFHKYNWIILDGEFEHYYKIDCIRNYIANIIKKRSEILWEDWDKNKLQRSLEILDYRLEKVQKTRKISKAYAKLFNKYFHRYGKPTIAFNLSIWLSQNNGFKKWLIKALQQIIDKLEEN